MIKPLTSLRFFFALMVFSCHLHFIKPSDSKILWWLWENILKEGYIGVSFFFILSGFIISYNYSNILLWNKHNFRNYIIARFARIYPLHLLTLILSIPLTIKYLNREEHINWFLKFLSNLTLTQSYFNKNEYYFSFNSLSWSVSVEMFFYLVFPLLIVFFFRFIKSNLTRVLFFIFLVLAIPFLIYNLKNIDHHQLFFMFPFVRLVDFIIGIFLFFAYKIIKDKSICRKNTIIEVFSIVIFMVFFLLKDNISINYRFSVYYWIPISLIILTFATQDGLISKFLNSEKMVVLGELSFAFYLFHLLVYEYFCALNIRIFHFSNPLTIIFINLSATLTISYLSFKYYEKPLNKYIKDKLNVFSKLKQN